MKYKIQMEHHKGEAAVMAHEVMPLASGVEIDPEVLATQGIRIATSLAGFNYLVIIPEKDDGCQCKACRDGAKHASDCAVHNEPAERIGPCTCGIVPSVCTGCTHRIEDYRLCAAWQKGKCTIPGVEPPSLDELFNEDPVDQWEAMLGQEGSE